MTTDKDIAAAARMIYIQAGVTTAMPPANVSFISPEERELLADWYRRASGQLSFSLASR